MLFLNFALIMTNYQQEKEEQRKTLRERGICVIIPTYNNGGTIGRVVRETLQECNDVIVVDDGCTDDTATILAQIEGVTVVRHERNRGKGQALKSGFRKAKEMGFAYAITLDGDGQHYPRDIAKMLKANIEHPGAFIIGSRNLEGVERSGGSSFANKFANFWFNLQTGRKVGDTQSGYRLYALRKLRLLGLVSARYEAELSLLVFASWHGAQIFETPIDVYYPPKEERVSHFRPAADFGRISVLNTCLCFMAILYGLPVTIIRTLINLILTIYTAFIFFMATAVIFTPFIWIYSHIGKMTERKKMVIHNIIYHTARFVMINHGLPRVKYRQVVAPEVDMDKPSVFICNHQSTIDILCNLCLSPKMVLLTKDWVRRNPFFGFIVRSADYPTTSEGFDKITPELKALMDKGFSILIYPEGTRSKSGGMSRFHQGAFVVAETLGATVTPITLYGTRRVTSTSNLWMTPGVVEMHVGTPVSRDEMNAMGSALKQASQMRKRCQETYATISNRVDQEL